MGQPRLRFVWGQELRERLGKETVFRYSLGTIAYNVGWTVQYFDKRGKTGKIRTYPACLDPPHIPPSVKALITPMVEYEELGMPRWFVEQLMPPELFNEIEWQNAREDLECEFGSDVMGEFPRHGLYTDAFHVIADHSECKCDKWGRQPNGDKCYGAYRAPDQRDIAYIKWMLHELELEGHYYDWTEMPPQHIVEQHIRDRIREADARYEYAATERGRELQDLISPHSQRITRPTTGGMDCTKWFDCTKWIQDAKEGTQIITP